MPRKIPRKKMTAMKKLIIEKLLEGEPPAIAARSVEISRMEAYRWRKEDAKFAEEWDNAVQEGIDKLEGIAYKRAAESSDGLLTMYLKCRRPEVWNPPPPEPPPVTDNVEFKNKTVFEAIERVRRLGLPRPEMFEGDFIEEKKK